MASDNSEEFTSIYAYNPSLAASILFAALYMIPWNYHVYLTYVHTCRGRDKTKGLGEHKGKKTNHARSCLLIFACGMEVTGYALRCASIKSPVDVGLFATSQSMIVIAPVFICANLYLLTRRLIYAEVSDAVDEKQQRVLGISPRWLPRLFIASDVMSFMTQGAGSGVASSGNWTGTEKDVGVGILIAGLGLQTITFILFMVVIVRFHYRIGWAGVNMGTNQVLKGVYIAGAFILIRSVYRIIEFALGVDGYPFTHEWPLYVLESVPMLFALLALGWYHPDKWLLPTSSPSNTASEDREKIQGVEHA